MVPTIGSTRAEGCMRIEDVERMKDYVRLLFEKEVDPTAKLELIDAMQRLGLGYHFEGDIKRVLGSIHKETNVMNRPHSRDYYRDNLHTVALRFRLLRQHGYHEMPEDVFHEFMDGSGHFMLELGEDVEGMLNLYEASFHAFEGEIILDEARVFSTAHLRCLKDDISSPVMAKKIKHALELPIHWRPIRVEAEWFMEAYEKSSNPALLQLAMIDYNIVQSVHQEELSRLEKWWSDLKLGTSMVFSRDNLTGHFLWNVMMIFEPRYKHFREMTTKIACLITLIDDVYDKLGASLEELELLTHLIDRWDITRADELTPTIRTCFEALRSVTDEVSCWVLKERGIDVSRYLQKAWADQCKAYLMEANWCHKGIKPSQRDYLSNAVITVGGFNVLLACFVITTDDLTEAKLDYISRIPGVMQCSTLISRLNNDLVPTSIGSAAGDQLNSVQCIMNEMGASEEEAMKNIQDLVHETWKALNRHMFEDKYRLSGPFVSTCRNLARASHWIYQYGDGHEVGSVEKSNEHLTSIISSRREVQTLSK